MPYLLITIFIFTTLIVNTQTTKINLENTTSEQKIKIYNTTIETLDSNKVDEIYFYAQKALLLLDTNPNDDERATTLFALGKVNIKLADYDKAKDYFTRAYYITKNKNLKMQIAFNLGMLLKDNNKKEALSYFKELENYDTNLLLQSTALFEASKLARDLTKYDESKNIIEKLSKINLYKYLADIELGYLAYLNKDFKSAISYWNNACIEGKADRNALIITNLALANLYFSQNNMNETIFYAERAILNSAESDNYPLVLNAQTILFNALFQNKQFEKALNILNLKLDTIKEMNENKTTLQELFIKNSFESKELNKEITKLEFKNNIYKTIIVIIILLNLAFAFFYVRNTKRHQQ